MLVALPSSIGFGVLVYSAIGPERAGDGALAGILGAAVTSGIVAPLVGRNGGFITAPCAPAAAVMSGLGRQLRGRSHFSPERIATLLALTALVSALLQVALRRGARRPADQVHSLPGGERLPVGRRAGHRDRPIAQAPRPAEAMSRLRTGSVCAGALELERDRRRRGDDRRHGRRRRPLRRRCRRRSSGCSPASPRTSRSPRSIRRCGSLEGNTLVIGPIQATGIAFRRSDRARRVARRHATLPTSHSCSVRP